MAVHQGAVNPTELPERFAHFQILKRLGKGGMGTVYLALDQRLDRRVALKVCHIADKPEALERFKREAQAAASLRHANLCPVHDFDVCDGVPYFTMSFIEGPTLDKWVDERGGLSQRDAALLVGKLALALQYAHERGVVHRDLKPANIAMDGREPIVLDFGLARLQEKSDRKLTKSGAILGTPSYMSPEQVEGDPEAIGPAADVYSLGVILYELLSGRLPFEGPMTAVLAHILVNVPPAPRSFRPDLDPALEGICLKALRKKPAERWPSMKDFATALVHWVKDSQAATTGPKLGSARRKETAEALPPNHELAPNLRNRSGPVVSLPATIGLLSGPAPQTPMGQPPSKSEAVMPAEPARGKKGRWPRSRPDVRNRKLAIVALSVAVLVLAFLALFFVVFRPPRPNPNTPTDNKTRSKEQSSPTDPPSLDPDRKAAEYVLSIGGTVRVNEQFTQIRGAADLPRELFQLTYVDLQSNKQLSDAGLAQFKDCKNLTSLHLGATQVSDAGLAHFINFKNLKELALANTRVSDAGLAQLKDRKNLVYLDLANTQVSDTGMSHFKDCKNLTTLDVHSTQVSDAALAHFKDCKNLMYLHLANTQVSDAGLAHFKDCKNLTSLQLYNTQVSNAGMAHFKDYKNLAILFLNNTQVSDEGLAHLKDCKNLTNLNLGGTKVTAAGIEELKKALPKCNIEWVKQD